MRWSVWRIEAVKVVLQGEDSTWSMTSSDSCTYTKNSTTMDPQVLIESHPGLEINRLRSLPLEHTLRAANASRQKLREHNQYVKVQLQHDPRSKHLRPTPCVYDAVARRLQNGCQPHGSRRQVRLRGNVGTRSNAFPGMVSIPCRPSATKERMQEPRGSLMNGKLSTINDQIRM